MPYGPAHPIWLEFFERQPTACFLAEVVRDGAGRGAGWRFLRVNAAWEVLTGKTRAQGEGQLNTDVFPGTSDDWLQAFADMVDAGAPVTFTRRTRLFNGWFDVAAFPLGGQLFAASFTDGTARMAGIEARERTERELHEASDLLRNVFQESPAFMAALSGPRHVFQMVNGRYKRLLGGREVIGKPVAEALPEVVPQGYIEILDRVYRSGEPFVGKDVPRLLPAVGDEPPQQRFMDLVYLPLRDASGAVSGILFHGVDQTERKRAEDGLRAVASELSEVDRRRADFLATLAHELRNPLAPLRNGLQIMRMASGDPALIGRARDMMERQVSNLVHLVDDLLDVARISGGKIELKRGAVALQDVLARAVETSLSAIDAQRHALDVFVPPAPIAVDVDAARIAQVVSNLLNNAAKYTPADGRIELAAHVDGSEAVVSVSDNGVAIAAEHLDTVFDMFSQAREHLGMSQGGLGIGLALSRTLATLHGGSISAHSEGRGQGSRFELRLPLAAAGVALPAGVAPAPALVHEAPPRRLRVLIVDDNLDAGDSLALRVELAGHEVRLARDGLAGLEAARSLKPEIAFLDIGMPGMNGYELAAAMRASDECAGTLLVALSGWGSRRDVERGRTAGFDEHFTKPAQVGQVEELLVREAARRHADDAAR